MMDSLIFVIQNFRFYVKYRITNNFTIFVWNQTSHITHKVSIRVDLSEIGSARAEQSLIPQKPSWRSQTSTNSIPQTSMDSTIKTRFRGIVLGSFCCTNQDVWEVFWGFNGGREVFWSKEMKQRRRNMDQLIYWSLLFFISSAPPRTSILQPRT